MKHGLARNIHPGASEHYSDAEAYEARYEARAEDVAHYVRKCRGAESILEYGAGAGRLTLPLAAAGAEVLAVDTSAEMLALLRKRLRGGDPGIVARVSSRRADMRTFRTKRRFDVVVAGFHTLCHLYSPSDMESFLDRVRTHLLPGGKLEFDLPLPRIDVPGYDPISQVRITEMDAPLGPQLLTQRWYQPQEVALYLDHFGFKSVALRSDFTSARIDRETNVFTVSARRP